MSNMLNEVYYLPELISEQIPRLDKEVKSILNHREITSIKEIIFTGCGDSYFAGLGARHFFQRVCNISTRAIQSMDASRYDLVDYNSAFPGNPLVMATSVSGKVVRTVESLNVAKEKGSLTVAIVGDLESPLAKTAERNIHCDLKALPRSPGVASYRVSQVAMFLFGIHIAEVRGRISITEGEKLRDDLKNTANQIETTIKLCDEKSQELSRVLRDEKYITIIGDGPNLASAIFSAAKVTEGVGAIAVAQNTEEWAHLQYFENAFPAIPTFIITSRNRGYNRVLELLDPMKRIGRNIIAVASEDCKELLAESNFFFVVDKNVNDMYSPIVYPVPLELFTSYWAEETNAGYYRENLDTYPRYANTIRDNKLMSVEEIKSNG